MVAVFSDFFLHHAGADRPEDRHRGLQQPDANRITRYRKYQNTFEGDTISILDIGTLGIRYGARRGRGNF